MNLFNRVAEVIVAPPGSKIGTSFKGFRTHFSVDKTTEYTANDATISLYNLSPAHRTYLESADMQNPNKTLVAILNAGYLGIGANDSLIGTIYVGDIFYTSTERQGADTITKMILKDGGSCLNQCYMNITFPSATMASALVDYMCRQMQSQFKLTYTRPSFLSINDYQYVSPTGLLGPVAKNMNDIVPRLGLRWSIQNGAIVFQQPKVQAPKTVVLSKDTGMIGIPVKRENGNIEATSLLNPTIYPGMSVNIISSVESAFSKNNAKLNNTYNVERALYEGDSYEGDWTVKIEGRKAA